MRFIPREIQGVRIFLGAELNIIDRNGNVDLPPHYLERLDFVMAGLHEGCGFDDMGSAANTDAIVAAMHNPRIKAISHPGNPIFPFDHRAVVQAAEETGTALEFNNASFSKSRGGSRPNCENLARLLADAKGLAIIGSDAHIAQGVGEFEDAVAVLQQAGVSEEQVVNSSIPRLLRFLELAA
jgi:putative hydrolase